jgi:hypothetical protein
MICPPQTSGGQIKKRELGRICDTDIFEDGVCNLVGKRKRKSHLEELGVDGC